MNLALRLTLSRFRYWLCISLVLSFLPCSKYWTATWPMAQVPVAAMAACNNPARPGDQLGALHGQKRRAMPPTMVAARVLACWSVIGLTKDGGDAQHHPRLHRQQEGDVQSGDRFGADEGVQDRGVADNLVGRLATVGRQGPAHGYRQSGVGVDHAGQQRMGDVGSLLGRDGDQVVARPACCRASATTASSSFLTRSILFRTTRTGLPVALSCWSRA